MADENNNNNNNNNPNRSNLGSARLTLNTANLTKDQKKLLIRADKNAKERQELEAQGIEFIFPLWAFFEASDPSKPLYFAATERDINYALDQYLYLKHYDHFRLWCPNHDLPIDHAESWLRYCQEVIYPAEDPNNPSYVVVQVRYGPQHIAGLMRMINNCTPLCIPLDTDEEHEALCTRLDEAAPSELTPIERSIMQYLDDIADLNVEGSDRIMEKVNQKQAEMADTHNTKENKKYDA